MAEHRSRKRSAQAADGGNKKHRRRRAFKIDYFSMLPAELLIDIFQYLDQKELLALVLTCRNFEAPAGELLWKNVFLDVGKDEISDQLIDHWATKGVWKKTLTLEFQCDASDDQQAAVSRVLSSIPKDIIKAMSFAEDSEVSPGLYTDTMTFVKQQSKLEKLALPETPHRNPRSTCQHISYGLRFEHDQSQPGFNDLIAVDAGNTEMHDMLRSFFHPGARASSVEIWGCVGLSSHAPLCNPWAKISRLAQDANFLQQVTSITLARVVLHGASFSVTDMASCTDLAHVTRLVIDDCHNVDNFLAASHQKHLFGGLRSFVLSSRYHFAPTDHNYIQFIVQQKHLEELGQLFSVNLRHQLWSNTSHFIHGDIDRNLKKLSVDLHLDCTETGGTRHLENILTRCSGLTHLQFNFCDGKSLDIEGRQVEDWKENVRTLARMLSTAPSLRHVSMMLPSSRHTKAFAVDGKKDRILITAQLTANVFCAEGFLPDELSLILQPPPNPMPSELLFKAHVYKLRYKNSGQQAISVEAIWQKGAVDWARFGRVRDVRDRIRQSIAEVK